MPLTRRRLASLIAGAAGAVAVGRPGPARAQDISGWVQDVLDDWVFPDEPAVAVAVTFPGGRGQAVAGAADIAARRPARMADRFRIASVTKTFVATAVCQAAANGQLDLDRPAATWLDPALIRDLANADRATVRDLLAMRAGVPEYTDNPAIDRALAAAPRARRSLADWLDFARGRPAPFPPGAGYDYSNSNYLLLEAMLERATGAPLAETLAAGIFRPLGMAATGIETPDRFAQGIVRGYEETGSGFRDVTEIDDATGRGDGGMISTAGDLVGFLPALFGGRLLPPPMVAEMTRMRPDGDGGDYGLGIYTMDSDFGRLFGHEGSSAGFAAEIAYSPRDAISVAVVTNNMDSDLPWDVREETLAIVLDG